MEEVTDSSGKLTHPKFRIDPPDNILQVAECKVNPGMVLGTSNTDDLFRIHLQLAGMRRVRAAMRTRDAHPSLAYHTDRLGLALPPCPQHPAQLRDIVSPPRVQTDQYLQKLRTTEWHRAGRNLEKIGDNFPKSGQMGRSPPKFSYKIWEHFAKSEDIF